jgi:type IV pilus assembly protein PilE
VQNRQSGVTLMELLTVLVIIGILSAIAVPSYRGYVVRANRSEGKTALMFYAGALERCYTRYNSYVFDSNAALGCAVGFPQTSENGHYQITTSDRSATAFTLVATPQGGQATGDAGCGSLTLNQLNTRGRTGTKPIPECWGK